MRRLIKKILPGSIGGRCFFGLLLGIVFGFFLGERLEIIAPIGKIFLRASQVVVMPYLICELISSLGRLKASSMQLLIRFGGLGYLSVLLLGGLVVVVMPGVLPNLDSAEFFSPDLLEQSVLPDLVETYVPFNIFSALAADNFPAVVLFSVFVGLSAQRLPQKEVLLGPIEQLRLIFDHLNGLVVKWIAPFGIFSLTAATIASLTPALILRSKALLLINLVAFACIAGLSFGFVILFTPLTMQASWRILRGPLSIAASSGNLFIALPLLTKNLRKEIELLLVLDSTFERQRILEEISALVPVAFSLPSLGQVVSLSFLPFAAWFIDRPLSPSETVSMLATGIPAVAGGLKNAIRLGLDQLGLPENLIGLFLLNADWLYREQKILSLLGIALLVVFVVFAGLNRLDFKPLKVFGASTLLLTLAFSAGLSGRSYLSHSLKSSYQNDKILMRLSPLEENLGLIVGSCSSWHSMPTTLKDIKSRGYLRVGVQQEVAPWAFRNESGSLVGFDIDLLNRLAVDLGVRLEICLSTLDQIEPLLKSGRLDIVAGGIIDDGLRFNELLTTDGYQKVHFALVAADEKVPLFQDFPGNLVDRPLRLVVTDRELIDRNLRDRMAELLSKNDRAIPITIEAIPSRDYFYENRYLYDGLILSAESGASWSVLYPDTTMLPVFGDSLKARLVLLLGGRNLAFLSFVDKWINKQDSLGWLDKLFRYWVLVDQVERQQVERQQVE